jgi:hypothetical protein|tara:strand:+ start:127 stop:249 length:123 start_codon:yes stop_codon:yes gene_type:complete
MKASPNATRRTVIIMYGLNSIPICLEYLSEYYATVVERDF